MSRAEFVRVRPADPVAKGEPMGDFSPLEEDVLLKGVLTVVVRRKDGRPCVGWMVLVRGCGFI